MAEPREIYRDRWLVVLEKPYGMPTQARADRDGDDLFGWLKATEPLASLHHRLDQPASGLVLFAVHPDANRGLTEAFRNHTIARRYRVVLAGTPRAAAWTWEVDGKQARSEVEVLGSDNGFCAARVSLETGRKHQIRIHASMAGTPVVGDRRYGAEAGRMWPRLALHAAELHLSHPVTGGALTLYSPLPDDLQELWELAGGPG